MSLKSALNELSNAVKDLATLEVSTYTGTLEQAVDPQTGELNWDAFKPKGDLTLVASTRVNADYDTVNFRASDTDGEKLQELLQLHKTAVESAQNGRLAIINMFKSALGL